MTSSQIPALLRAARGLTDNDAEAISLLLGTLTMLCGKSNDPMAVLGIVIDSLVRAQALVGKTIATRGEVS